MYNISNQKPRIIIKLLILFVFFSSVIYFLLAYVSKQTQEQYLKQTTQTYNRAYKTIYNQFESTSNIISSGLIRLGQMKKNLDGIDEKSLEEQHKIRMEIYNKIIHRFNSLKQKHIQSINVFLPNKKLFLKMKKIKDYGKKLSNLRHSIEYVIKNKKPINTYETGKHGAGYRFVYPIISDSKFLGVLSITYGAEAITSNIMKQYDVLSNFYIVQSLFNEKLLKKKHAKFGVSHHKGYLYDFGVLKELKEKSKKDISQLKPKKNITNSVNTLMDKEISQSLFYNNKKLIFTAIPIYHNITNQKMGSLTIRSKGNDLYTIKQSQNIIFALMLILLIITLYLIYQQNLKELSEKKSLYEASLKDKQLLEQAKLAQMGEMIGNIAHQWRQPLSVISTVASGIQLEQKLGAFSEKELDKNMELVLSNTKYLSETIDTFRDFLKEGNEISEVILEHKITETINIISSSLKNSHIELQDNIDYEKNTITTIPNGSLPQILMNLINNSKDAIIKSDPENRWIKLDMKVQNDVVILSVEDNGGGIKESILNNIFEPYFTTKHQSQGTGLGLYMSHEIAKKHLGGKLYVENKKYGAKFFLEIPLKDKSN